MDSGTTRLKFLCILLAPLAPAAACIAGAGGENIATGQGALISADTEIDPDDLVDPIDVGGGPLEIAQSCAEAAECPAAKPFCINGICKRNRCGDAACDPGETAVSCPSDCHGGTDGGVCTTCVSQVCGYDSHCGTPILCGTCPSTWSCIQGACFEGGAPDGGAGGGSGPGGCCKITDECWITGAKRCPPNQN